MNSSDLKISITYTSILKEEYRNHEFITSLVEKSSIANKHLSIGGKIEIQCPFKFIKQTIYGKESVTMSLYKRIKQDDRHTITSEDISVITRETNGDWGMIWVNREIGKHYCIIDTMESQTLPPSPKQPSPRNIPDIFRPKNFD
jgi:hypothetical protein